MIFAVRHTIQYSYSKPVFLEPHIFRLRPRCDFARQIEQFSLAISPQPAGQHEFLDAEGNQAVCAWFEGLTDSLNITSSFTVKTSPVNPFAYLITDSDFLRLPAKYPNNEATALAAFLENAESEMAVKNFIAPLIETAGNETIAFLSRLNQTLYEKFTVQPRKEGAPLPPAVVLQKKQGACRDLTVLFMACCRAAGIAARFVSGYVCSHNEGEGKHETPELHAWAEVYLPGGGWQGYDPTLGLVVTEEHIPLAASCTPAGAAPVTGNYRGTGAWAEMEFSITIRSCFGTTYHRSNSSSCVLNMLQ